MGNHYYDKDGNLHECDLREARKNSYVPSVTTIVQEFSNSYGLDLYKARQMFFASLTLPRPEGISDEEYFQLVKEDSEQHSEKAKSFGIKLHYNIKKMLREGHNLFVGDILINKAMEVVKWIETNKDSVIVDFKTQETKDGKFRVYDSWLFQLCGYSQAQIPYGEHCEISFSNEFFGGTIDYIKYMGLDRPRLINIIISSTEDIPIKVKKWSDDKRQWGWEVFKTMFKLYNIIKKL